ncbi:MAG: PAS domain S-box protein, partial [Deltaproteobacteria bacterium]|nr:PAS domain S-box protein [Deltaproteobacteria bacterium]
LFEAVPCIITVQDKNYKLLRYNHEFAEKFNPKPGDYCYHAYKGRDSKCENCPVEKTFEDGMPHHGEESGVGKDGTKTHWIVSTSPIKDSKGDIVAVLEMNLDITSRIQLEEELEKSERKYHAIFNNIPNPVFVLDMESLEVLDCNESVKIVYGYTKEDIINKSFMELFEDEDKDHYTFKLKTSNTVNQVKHLDKGNKTLFVNIRVSPSEYLNQKVLLVTTSDITKRLETEQQLIQASKMATLGEMATGVAHELNQPLSVIKTASRFLIKKISKNEKVEDDIFLTMSSKIDSNVDRASKIINHMRQFARKSDMDLEPVDINLVLEKAFEIFSQQLKLRGIEVAWDITDSLPKIMGDPSRLEQVFINFLLNARDAIEELEDKNSHQGYENQQVREKKIYLRTRCEDKIIIVEIEDTGKGIPPGIQNKIFEPFFTTKEVSKGTGLGLSISYGIIKDCGGTIHVKSSEGKGATFIIQFPIKDSD